MRLLDVFDEEPLPADSPFYKMDNVFLTPHTASNTVEAGQNMAFGAAKMIDLCRYLDKSQVGG